MALCAINIDGVVTVHIAGDYGSTYDTICGIDANDNYVGHFGFVDLPKNAKITCVACYGIWRHIKDVRLRDRDFSKSIQREVR